MKKRGRRRRGICANHHPLAVLHRFNHSNSALTRQTLRDPGTLATLDINHKARTPMFNTDKSPCHPPLVRSSLRHKPHRLPKQPGDPPSKGICIFHLSFLPSSFFFFASTVLWCSLRSNPLFIFMYASLL